MQIAVRCNIKTVSYNGCIIMEAMGEYVGVANKENHGMNTVVG
jgi:hypothetical protein